MVIGCRPILEHTEFGPLNKLLQVLGSWTLRAISKTTVRDAASGFLFPGSLPTAFHLFPASYCMERLIQAGNSNLRVDSADIGANPHTWPSRLFKSLPTYLWEIRQYNVQNVHCLSSRRIFRPFGGHPLTGALGLGIALHLVDLFVIPPRSTTRTYLPSLILLSVLALFAGLLFALGIIAELIRSQRQLTEEVLYLRRKAFDTLLKTYE